MTEDDLRKRELRVALVHDWLTGMRGGERVLAVFCEIFPRAEIYTLLHTPRSVSERIEKHRIFTSPLQSIPGIHRRYRSFLPLFPWAIGRFDLSGYDLVLSSSHCVAKGAPSGGSPHLCYCHTPMRYMWDRFEDYFGPGRPISQRIVGRALRRRLQDWDRRSNARVDRFIANSRHVARRIERFYEREAEVIHPPVDVERFSVSTEREDYYVIISALAPYKRVEVAIDAFAGSGRRLLIAGQGPEEERLRKRARNVREVEWLGWQSDEGVTRLLSGARALLLPGEEDFGITPVEAMAAGTPVIALGSGGALETVVDLRSPGSREPTGVLVDEPTAEAFADAVRLLESHAKDLDPWALRRHAETFSTEVFRTRMVGAIERFLEAPGAPHAQPGPAASRPAGSGLSPDRPVVDRRTDRPVADRSDDAPRPREALLAADVSTEDPPRHNDGLSR